MPRASTPGVDGPRTAAPPSPFRLVRAALGGPWISRGKLRLALAGLWLLDGVLQLQPFMFTRGFAHEVIAPAAAGQPSWVAAMVHWAASLILVDPPVWNALFASSQLAIGTALCFRRSARAGIVASIAWSVGVWALGEGLGGLVGGSATFLTGAPGAVILYALLGLAAWPQPRRSERAARIQRTARRTGPSRSPRAGDERPARWIAVSWAALWTLFALLQALPRNASARELARQLRSNASSAPGWVAHAEQSLGHAASMAGTGPVVLLVATELAIGLFGLWRGWPRRAAATVGIAVALVVWVVGQAFGQILTGMGTDPNSAPLVALLGVALLGRVDDKPSVAAHGAVVRPDAPLVGQDAA